MVGNKFWKDILLFDKNYRSDNFILDKNALLYVTKKRDLWMCQEMSASLFSWVSSSLGSSLNQKARGETPSAQSTHGCEEARHSSSGLPMNIRNNSLGFGSPSTSLRWATHFFLYFCLNILQIPLPQRNKDAAGFISSKTKETGIFLHQIPVVRLIES